MKIILSLLHITPKMSTSILSFENVRDANTYLSSLSTDTKLVKRIMVDECLIDILLPGKPHTKTDKPCEKNGYGLYIHHVKVRPLTKSLKACQLSDNIAKHLLSIYHGYELDNSKTGYSPVFTNGGFVNNECDSQPEFEDSDSSDDDSSDSESSDDDSSDRNNLKQNKKNFPIIDFQFKGNYVGRKNLF